MSNFLSKFRRLAPDFLSVNLLLVFFFYCSCPLFCQSWGAFGARLLLVNLLLVFFLLLQIFIGKFVVNFFLLLLVSTFLSKLRCVWRQIDGPGFQPPHDNQGCCNNNRDLEKKTEQWGWLQDSIYTHNRHFIAFTTTNRNHESNNELNSWQGC